MKTRAYPYNLVFNILICLSLSISAFAGSEGDIEIKKAYKRLAIEYHPDKVSYLGEEVQNAAKEKFQKLNEAYEKIKKERGFV